MMFIKEKYIFYSYILMKDIHYIDQLKGRNRSVFF
jgi:hypothetical protein